MARKDIITMSQKELKRLHIIRKVLDKRLKQIDAAKILRLCKRQVGRITARVREEGDAGVIHRSRGTPSHNRIPEKKKERIIKLYRDKYKGFGPLLASEKLFEIDKIKISDETLRNWLIEKGVWKKRRKAREHRQWRERKHHFGEMVQLDGSHHSWLEGRGPECVLMGYIDDATNTVYARFYSYEGTFPAMDSFRCYIKKYGIPSSIYLDKHSTYKSSAKRSIEDDLNNQDPLSHFERSLKELGVDVIHAHSPQAKGRVERLFETLQDRLIKEMRLKGIKSIKEANNLLAHYLPGFNKKFAVPPMEKGDLHRPLSQGIDLDKILCKRKNRALRNDFTVVHFKKLYQILDRVNTKVVTVEERINGTMLITHRGKNLRYKPITQRPVKKEPKKPYTFKIKKVWSPPIDHPLKGAFFRRRYPQGYTYPQKEKGTQKEKRRLLLKT